MILGDRDEIMPRWMKKAAGRTTWRRQSRDRRFKVTAYVDAARAHWFLVEHEEYGETGPAFLLDRYEIILWGRVIASIQQWMDANQVGDVR